MNKNQKNKTPVFIIAEAGSNWKAGSPSADWKRACKLIDAAKFASADAVKFQTFRADSVYVPNAGASDYLSKRGICESIVDLFHFFSMPYDMIPRLAAYCKKRKIEFMSSFFSVEDFNAVNPWVKRNKIASYEITHPRLLKLAAKSGKPLILSTGAATYKDIDWAVGYFKRMNGKNLTLLQCTAKYPAVFDSLNLWAIPNISRRYGLPAGFSDHSLDPVVGPVAATALGAVVIEKHFTLSRKLKGPDHAFAIEPQELRQMVSAVRSCQKALGSGKKELLPDEEELYLYAQRAVQAISEIARGETLKENQNIAILRAGSQKKGMHPRWLARAEGRKAKRHIPLGDGILLTDF